MKALFEKCIRYGQEVLSLMLQWKPRILLALAFLLPGVPHIFSKKRFCPGCLLCLFGMGALASLTGGILLIFRGIHGFDVISSKFLGYYMWLYPLWINSSIVSSTNLIPISVEGTPYWIQPFFWEQLFTFIIIYIVCAAISFWYQWRQYSVNSKQ